MSLINRMKTLKKSIVRIIIATIVILTVSIVATASYLILRKDKKTLITIMTGLKTLIPGLSNFIEMKVTR